MPSPQAAHKCLILSYIVYLWKMICLQTVLMLSRRAEHGSMVIADRKWNPAMLHRAICPRPTKDWVVKGSWQQAGV